MLKKISIVLAVLAVVSSGFSALAKDSITSEKYFVATKQLPHETRFMTGDWQDTRTYLSREKGVDFSSSFVCDILGNVTGGKEQGGRYDHSLGWDVNFDLEKLAGLRGTQFHISGLWRQGQNLSTATIGNRIVVSSIYGMEQFRFYGLWLEKYFFDKRLNIKAGRISAGDDFDMSPLYWTFVSNGTDGNLISVPINLFFPCYPNAVWGARATVDLTHDFWFKASVYNGDPGVPRESMYGLDFSLRLKEGLLTVEEISFTPNTAAGSKGLPGHYKAGAYYHGGTFRDLYSDVNGASYALTGLPRKKHIGNYGVYLQADQMIWREKDAPKDEGLTFLLGAALAPSCVNELGSFFMAGAIYKGLVPGRDQDVTAFQFMFTRWSDDWRSNVRDSGGAVPSYESVLEFTHKISITPWMYLQPDIQYVMNPRGGHDIDNALVIGTRFGIIF